MSVINAFASVVDNEAGVQPKGFGQVMGFKVKPQGWTDNLGVQDVEGYVPEVGGTVAFQVLVVKAGEHEDGWSYLAGYRDTVVSSWVEAPAKVSGGVVLGYFVKTAGGYTVDVTDYVNANAAGYVPDTDKYMDTVSGK